MKLRKNTWQKVKLEKLFKLKSGNALPQRNIVYGKHPVYGGNGIVGFHNFFMIEDATIVIGRVGEYCGSIHLTKPKSWITDNGLYPIEFFSEINFGFLENALRNLDLNQYAQKTGQPSISQTTLSQIEIELPSLPEQTQIAELFQSIETAIEQAEQQENNLLKLKNQLLRSCLKIELEKYYV